MAHDTLHIVPEDRREAARAAVRSAFGAAQPTDLKPIVGGASGALIYRLQIGDRAYVLRLDKLQRDLLRDPKRHYSCMTTAAEAGLAPALHHADPDAAIAIIDFVIQQPLQAFPGGPEALTRELGQFIARLQATPAFPTVAAFPQVVTGLMRHVCGSPLFAPGLLDPHLDRFAKLRDAYPWGAEAAVSSHNDPNFRNLMSDGQRLWLVDWETAYANDPMVDLAIVANELEASRERADLLLSAWRGRPPDTVLSARMLLMRKIVPLYYAGLAFSAFAVMPRETPETDLSAPTPDAFRAAFADGRLKIGDPNTLYVLAKMMLAGFLAGAQAPGVDEAIARVTAG